MLPKTPWSNHGSGDIIDADGRDVCAVYPRLDMSDDEIADRICADVNACAGISDEHLSQGVVPVHQHSSLADSHADLMIAARAAEAVFAKQRWNEGSIDPEAVALRMLRKAIAGSEGRS